MCKDETEMETHECWKHELMKAYKKRSKKGNVIGHGDSAANNSSDTA
jgi:hypothetical protein